MIRRRDGKSPPPQLKTPGMPDWFALNHSRRRYGKHIRRWRRESRGCQALVEKLSSNPLVFKGMLKRTFLPRKLHGKSSLETVVEKVQNLAFR
jgi:hypothetical protein